MSPRYALSWDNVGLLAGREDKEVAKIYVALDAKDEVVDEAILAGADMLVTHHPLIFSGMKQVNNQNFIGRRLVKLIQHDISYYAMHTNYDVKGMADLAADYLKLENCLIYHFICSIQCHIYFCNFFIISSCQQSDIIPGKSV